MTMQWMLVALMVGFDAGPTQEWDFRPDSFRIKSIVECKRLSAEAWESYIDELDRRRMSGPLMEIIKAKIPGYHSALTSYTRTVSTKQALELCNNFPLGSTEWEYATFGLQWHRKNDQIVQYVRSCHRNGGIFVRAHCYHICTGARWDILTQEALRDRDSTILCGKGLGYLGDYARWYLEGLKRPIQRR